MWIAGDEAQHSSYILWEMLVFDYPLLSRRFSKAVAL